MFGELPVDLCRGVITIDTKELSNVLRSLITQIDRHEKQISGLVEQVRALQTAMGSSTDTLRESLADVKRQLTAHETLLRVSQQQADMAVSKTQFHQQIHHFNETLQNMQEKVRSLERDGGENVVHRMEKYVADFVPKWYADVGQKEAATRDTQILEKAREAHSKELGDVVALLNKKLDGKASQEYLNSSINSVRVEAAHAQTAAQSEFDRTQSFIRDFEKKSDKATTESRTALEQKIGSVSSRVSALFGILSLPEWECVRLSSETSRATYSESAAGFGKTAMPDDLSAPQSAADSEIDRKTAFLLETPVFLSFRHQILRDIADRLSVSRDAQSSDLDVELLDIRNEIRARCTAPRVVELIKQYSDTETATRVAFLQRKFQELDFDKVSTSQFNEALRGKSDLQALNAKADHAVLSELADAIKEHFLKLDENIKELQDERLEFKEVLRDVLYMHKRAQLHHDDPPAANGQSATVTPPRRPKHSDELFDEPPSPHQGIDPRSSDPIVVHSSSSDAKPRAHDSSFGAENAARSVTPRESKHNRGNRVVRPMTDHVHKEQEAAHLSGIVTPPRLKKRLEVPPISTLGPIRRPNVEDVVPLTSNQQEYARAVAEATMRREMAAKPVPPYSRDLKAQQVRKVFTPTGGVQL